MTPNSTLEVGRCGQPGCIRVARWRIEVPGGERGPDYLCGTHRGALAATLHAIGAVCHRVDPRVEK